jgi:hypothetical protein
MSLDADDADRSFALIAKSVSTACRFDSRQSFPIAKVALSSMPLDVARCRRSSWTPTIASRDSGAWPFHAVTENGWFIAATWMAVGLALASIWRGISVALIEILVGEKAIALPLSRSGSHKVPFL